MNPNLFFAMVAAVAAIIGANMSLISWIRGDMAKFEAEMKADTRAFQNEIRGWKDEINAELKDFHGRLCATEERGKK